MTRDEPALFYCRASECGAIAKGYSEAGQHELRHHNGAWTCYTQEGDDT